MGLFGNKRSVVHVAADGLDRGEHPEMCALGPPDVVGEGNRQHELRKVLRAEGREVTVCLLAEPDNPHDPNAVMVRALLWEGDKVAGGPHVGYLSRGCAEDWSPLLQKLGEGVYMNAVLAGGTRDKPSIGVFIRDDEFDAPSGEDEEG